MKKNGFTLIELLAVLIILSLLFIISMPKVSEIINRSKNTIKNQEYKRILNAAYDFSLENSSLYLSNNTSYLTLANLKYNRLIDAEIKDPESGEAIEDCTVISIKPIVNKSNISCHNDYLCQGNYLYHIEPKQADYDTKKPIILIDGVNLETKSVEVDYNVSYNLPTVTSTTYDGNTDLTSKIIKNIYRNNEMVDSIDTSITTIYTVTYTVIDDYGYSNFSTLKVAVKDISAPVLTFDSDTLTIFVGDKPDLLKGVTCSDNSNKCDISIVGTVDYNKVGSYPVTYKAVDPTGNTTRLNRMIIVE